MPTKISLSTIAFWPFIILLTIGLLIPMPEREGPEGSDKIIHLLAFLCLGALHFFEFGRSAKSFVILLSYSALVEFGQGLTGYRSFEWWDLAANIAGCLQSRILLLSKYKLVS